ncbi:Gibberellin 20 oxidase 2 [Linum grandiflorum]
MSPPPPSATADSASPLVFDASLLQHQSNIPSQFVWPDEERPGTESPPVLAIPPIDLASFMSGDPAAVSAATKAVDEACRKHGFFLVVNHGVDADLVTEAHRCMDQFFGMKMSEKQRAQRKTGELCGYASSFTGRFSSKLPWKETLSFRYYDGDGDRRNIVRDYLLNKLGAEFTHFGEVYERYCEAMSNLSLGIMELLGVSLGVGGEHFREFYEENDSIMRLNYYPPCQKPELALGTGPHCDPTSLTILHQDQVGGLEVFVDGLWHSVTPHPGAFVVNIGDTFMALSNGVYRSCLHRAVLNRNQVRKSLAFFLCPNGEKVVKPPQSLLVSDIDNTESKNPKMTRRAYPDFTWPTLLEFTQKNYRADMKTLDAFTTWLQTQQTTKLIT